MINFIQTAKSIPLVINYNISQITRISCAKNESSNYFSNQLKKKQQNCHNLTPGLSHPKREVKRNACHAVIMVAHLFLPPPGESSNVINYLKKKREQQPKDQTGKNISNFSRFFVCVQITLALIRQFDMVAPPSARYCSLYPPSFFIPVPVTM